MSCTPGSDTEIWLSPCLRISGSETPVLLTRSSMISFARSRSSLSQLASLLGSRFEDDLEAALEVEAERRLAHDGEHGDTAERDDQGDQDEQVAAH